MADVVDLTSDYERWLGEHVPLVQADLDVKHREMAAEPFRFLRGSYYLWLVRSAQNLGELARFTRVPVVGDLHIENFGTWRDSDRSQRWGVNDFDELACAAWPGDLIRLATSAVCAPHIALSDKEICDLVLSCWKDAVPGPAVELGTDGSAHLTRLVPRPVAPGEYFAELAQLEAADPARIPEAVRDAVAGTVAASWRPTWHLRTAGTGSLGHPRFVAVGDDAGGEAQAREVKRLGPLSALWARSQVAAQLVPSGDGVQYEHVMTTLHGPDPSLRVGDWQVRRLAPDVSKIRLSRQSDADARSLLRSMARATASVHASDAAAFVAARAGADELGRKQFHEAVATMADAVHADYKVFASHFGR